MLILRNGTTVTVVDDYKHALANSFYMVENEAGDRYLMWKRHDNYRDDEKIHDLDIVDRTA